LLPWQLVFLVLRAAWLIRLFILGSHEILHIYFADDSIDAQLDRILHTLIEEFRFFVTASIVCWRWIVKGDIVSAGYGSFDVARLQEAVEVKR